MKNKKHISILKYIPLFLCIILTIIYFRNNKDISVEAILNYTPSNPIAAALVILFLYVLKSISVVFPIIILEIAAGHLFSTISAIIINMLGVIIGLVISYFIGYYSGSDAINKMVQKYPKLDMFVQKQTKNPFFTCFLLRAIYILPRDAVSIYLGALKFPFSTYLLTSILYALPSTILATLFGTSITEPTSPMFWISILSMILLSCGFLVISKIFFENKQP
ncbi:MAG TPA: VTT domain-containing protein [Tissierellaceae bacterium]